MIVNEFDGMVRNVELANGIYFFEIDIDGDVFFALQLHNGCKLRDNVKIRFRENEVSVAKNIENSISISNIHKAIVKNIDNGSLLARIQLLYKDKLLHCLVTEKSLKRLQIKINDEVYFLVKALCVEVFCE